jgi:hypothetical protein
MESQLRESEEERKILNSKYKEYSEKIKYYGLI